MDAEGVEYSQGVVHHLTLKIVNLFPNDTDGWTDLVTMEVIPIIDILNACPDDMPFCLIHADSLHGRCIRSPDGGKITQGVGVRDFHPLDVIVLMLVKRIDDGHKALGHMSAMAGIDRQDVISAMEFGWQFDNACALAILQAYQGTGRQTVGVAQFGVCYHAILGRYADLHRLTGKIPGPVSLKVYGKGSRGKHQRHCQR